MSDTVIDAGRIREAPVAPVHCASCYNQQPQMVHVDFMAAYDGPVIPGSPPVSIDDLVVCEICVKAAGRVLGMKEADEPSEVEKLKEQLKETRAKLRGAEDYIGKLEISVAAKQERKKT
jgi:hypothetical protein